MMMIDDILLIMKAIEMLLANGIYIVLWVDVMLGWLD